MLMLNCIYDLCINYCVCMLCIVEYHNLRAGGGDV